MSRGVAGAIRNHARRVADLWVARIVRPLGRGVYLVKKPGCDQVVEVTSPNSRLTYPPNMSVNLAAVQGEVQKTIISHPPLGRNGTSLFPGNDLGIGTLDALAVQPPADPPSVDAGSASSVHTVTGIGFNESPVDYVQAVESNGETDTQDPFVTVTNVTWISSTEIEITIDVSSSAPEDYSPFFRFRRS